MALTPTQRKETIENRLRKALSPASLELVDESHLHQGHPGAASGASHFALKIVSDAFISLSAIKRHQLIYDQLKDLIPSEIHALKINAKTPDESTPKL
jgi:BolA protein